MILFSSPARLPMLTVIASLRRQFRRSALVLLTLLGVGTIPASAKKAPPVAQRFDVGTYALELKLPHHWEVEVHQDDGYVLFGYNDRPAMVVKAAVGLFRIVIPAQARSADPVKLAAAYATHDLSGAQKAFLGGNAHLLPFAKKPKPLNEGQLYSFAEPKDANGIRGQSTEFVRGWVFFPNSYATDGVIFLILGRQKTPITEFRPAELEWVEELVTSIHR